MFLQDLTSRRQGKCAFLQLSPQEPRLRSLTVLAFDHGRENMAAREDAETDTLVQRHLACQQFGTITSATQGSRGTCPTSQA